MIVKTKFDIGDRIAFAWKGKGSSGTINEIGVGVTGTGTKIRYFIFGKPSEETKIISQESVTGLIPKKGVKA